MVKEMNSPETLRILFESLFAPAQLEFARLVSPLGAAIRARFPHVAKTSTLEFGDLDADALGRLDSASWTIAFDGNGENVPQMVDAVGGIWNRSVRTVWEISFTLRGPVLACQAAEVHINEIGQLVERWLDVTPSDALAFSAALAQPLGLRSFDGAILWGWVFPWEMLTDDMRLRSGDVENPSAFQLLFRPR